MGGKEGLRSVLCGFSHPCRKCPNLVRPAAEVPPGLDGRRRLGGGRGCSKGQTRSWAGSRPTTLGAEDFQALLPEGSGLGGPPDWVLTPRRPTAGTPRQKGAWPVPCPRGVFPIPESHSHPASALWVFLLIRLHLDAWKSRGGSGKQQIPSFAPGLHSSPRRPTALMGKTEGKTRGKMGGRWRGRWEKTFSGAAQVPWLQDRNVL